MKTPLWYFHAASSQDISSVVIQIKLHLQSIVLLGGFQRSQGSSFETHLITQYLVNIPGLVDTVNARSSHFTGLGHGK